MNGLKDSSRREFLKKTTYVVPVVLTLSATPALAGQGSHHKDRDKNKGRKKDNKDKYRGKDKDRNRGGHR
ncbi:MAG: hypothetical protein IPK65_01715 [Gammaproteobacteria bacterium]|nr:hypothetical protein [Gammaproteobacteria bacterium]